MESEEPPDVDIREQLRAIRAENARRRAEQPEPEPPKPPRDRRPDLARKSARVAPQLKPVKPIDVEALARRWTKAARPWWQNPWLVGIGGAVIGGVVSGLIVAALL